jgi:hypothetical protein
VFSGGRDVSIKSYLTWSVEIPDGILPSFRKALLGTHDKPRYTRIAHVAESLIELGMAEFQPYPHKPVALVIGSVSALALRCPSLEVRYRHPMAGRPYIHKMAGYG